MPFADKFALQGLLCNFGSDRYQIQAFNITQLHMEDKFEHLVKVQLVCSRMRQATWLCNRIGPSHHPPPLTPRMPVSFQITFLIGFPSRFSRRSQ